MSNKLKIGYFADGPWSHNAFDLLIEDKDIQIQFIVPRVDTQDEILRKFAEKHSIPFLFPVKINTPEFLDQVTSMDCDLFVSMSFNQIFRKEILNVPSLGTINCHAGKLPFYRGRNILNWALINDEKEFGITVHFVDEGIDTGDIICQNTYPITDNDNYGSLLQVAYKECANTLKEAINLIKENKIQPKTQSEIHPVGFYCGMRKEGDEIINWNQNSRELFNFIRAIASPGPQARTVVNGKMVKINSAKMIPEAPAYKGIPGQILAKSSHGFWIKTKDSFIEITDFKSEVKLKVGLRFGNK